MNIIICGAGRVGSTIAKMLIEQNHSITMIDQSSEDIQKINETLDVKAIVGKATSPTKKTSTTEHSSQSRWPLLADLLDGGIFIECPTVNSL